MDAYQARYSKSLCDLIENKIDELTRLLVSTPASDYASYKERTGHIKGLQWTLSEARDLEKNMSRPEGQKAAPNQARRDYES